MIGMHLPNELKEMNIAPMGVRQPFVEIQTPSLIRPSLNLSQSEEGSASNLHVLSPFPYQTSLSHQTSNPITTKPHIA